MCILQICKKKACCRYCSCVFKNMAFIYLQPVIFWPQLKSLGNNKENIVYNEEVYTLFRYRRPVKLSSKNVDFLYDMSNPLYAALAYGAELSGITSFKY